MQPRVVEKIPQNILTVFNIGFITGIFRKYGQELFLLADISAEIGERTVNG